MSGRSQPRLLAITVGTIQVGSTRIRLFNYLPYFEASGWSIKVHEPVARNIFHRLFEVFWLAWQAWQHDTVLLQKRLFPVWAIRLIRWNARRFIYEIDDPVFLDDATGAPIPYLERRLKAHLAIADAVTVDNPGLAEYCRQYNPSVHIIVSCVEMNKYTPTENASRPDPFVIGWVGQAPNLAYLQDIERALHKIHERYGDKVVFKVVCSQPYTSELFPVINKPWRLEDEPDDIRSFSVGIVPLRDYAWTKYKMAYRPYLYMACGVPVILSSVGPSLGVIEDGKEGFYAASEDDWYDALIRLIENPALCAEMSRSAVRKVTTEFSYQHNYPRFLEIISP